MKKWISLLSIPILCMPLLFNWQALEVLKLKTFDALVQIPEPSGTFVLLDITEEDVSMMGGWPFPRQGPHRRRSYGRGLGRRLSSTR